jgi:hypothetical protein
LFQKPGRKHRPQAELTTGTIPTTKGHDLIVKYRVQRTEGDHAHIAVFIAPDADRDYALAGTLIVRTSELADFRRALITNSTWENTPEALAAEREGARYPGEPGSLADIGRRQFARERAVRASMPAFLERPPVPGDDARG